MSLSGTCLTGLTVVGVYASVFQFLIVKKVNQSHDKKSISIKGFLLHSLPTGSGTTATTMNNKEILSRDFAIDAINP